MISPHLQRLPNPGAYAKFLRELRTLPSHAPVRFSWSHIVTAEMARREVRLALDRRINERGGRPEANVEMDIGLVRDARRLADMRLHRVRVYQFESELCRRRFGHLLARHDD